MSRSRKKNPVTWFAGRSNKAGKRQANKRFRRIIRQRIGSDYYLPTKVREIMDEWSMPGDGKCRWSEDIRDIRKLIKK